MIILLQSIQPRLDDIIMEAEAIIKSELLSQIIFRSSWKDVLKLVREKREASYKEPIVVISSTQFHDSETDKTLHDMDSARLAHMLKHYHFLDFYEYAHQRLGGPEIDGAIPVEEGHDKLTQFLEFLAQASQEGSMPTPTELLRDFYWLQE